MRRIRHHRQALVWIAFLAIWALAIVPTVSRLLAAGQGGSAWAEICTPQGMKSLATASDSQPQSPLKTAGLQHGEHCALCGLSAMPVAPPPVASAMPVQALAQAMPALFGAAPRPLFAWAAARPRGPPVRA